MRSDTMMVQRMIWNPRARPATPAQNPAFGRENSWDQTGLSKCGLGYLTDD
jgi:hypothetical protein